MQAHMLLARLLSGIAQWFLTHAFLKIKKNQEASTSHDVLFNISHIHSCSTVVDFCPDSVREPISWHFTYFSIHNGDISIAKYRLPSEE